MIHILSHHSPYEGFWALTEDGGEMLVTSVILWYIYFNYNRDFIIRGRR